MLDLELREWLGLGSGTSKTGASPIFRNSNVICDNNFATLQMASVSPLAPFSLVAPASLGLALVLKLNC